MLLKYIVSNFMSIGHPIEFSMFPTSENVEERLVKRIDTKAGEWKTLRRGGFFGPNASGKTTFIKSLYFAKNFIVNGQKSGKGTGINQFRGNIEELEGKSLFQFMFYLQGDVYEYGFSLGTEQVHEEWLMVLTEKGFQPLFARQTSEEGNTETEIESRFARKGSKERNLVEVLKESIGENQKNQLFLYKMYDNGVKRVECIIEWFQHLKIIFPKAKVQGLPLRMDKDDDFRRFILDSLKNMDTGVANISVVSDVMDFRDFIEKLNIPNEIVSQVEDMRNGILTFAGKYFIFGEGEKRQTLLVQIKFEHMLNGQIVPFNVEEESDGTRRLLDLLPILFSLSKNRQDIYFVDEIDRSLHTKLSQHLLREFLKGCEDTDSQIVFTSHDVNLINLEEFGQDEIWFVEKDGNGESHFRPFSDFEIEKGQDALRAYLNGRFGAVPLLKGEI